MLLEAIRQKVLVYSDRVLNAVVYALFLVYKFSTSSLDILIHFVGTDMNLGTKVLIRLLTFIYIKLPCCGNKVIGQYAPYV